MLNTIESHLQIRDSINITRNAQLTTHRWVCVNNTTKPQINTQQIRIEEDGFELSLGDGKRHILYTLVCAAHFHRIPWYT